MLIFLMLLLPSVFGLLESFLWLFLFLWKLDVLAAFPSYVEEISDPDKILMEDREDANRKTWGKLWLTHLLRAREDRGNWGAAVT